MAASFAVACLLGAISAFAAAGEKTEVKGMIIARAGETLVVNTKKGKVTVVLTDETKTKDNKGLLGLRKEYMANTVLIPGLKLKVNGVTDDQGRVIAKTISVDGDDLETAEMVQAGLHPTAEQVNANIQAIDANKQNITTNQQNIAANKQQAEQNIKDIQENTDRFSHLSDYDVKGEATVKFDVGSSKISAEGLEQLKKLAQAATALKGYIIEVKGFADSTGSAAVNDQLSEDRADAVVSYLIQQCSVPVRHIVAPGAMGEYQPAASNETEQGRSENRRVEVKVLVNKGITGG
jgi:outer membrane protein OmpA-like peptidoglycan-associated protein